MEIAGLKVLLVDDEELLREVVAMMVEDNGADVLCAGNGQEGLEIFKEQNDSISCVIMDFSMPEMNGYEAYCAMNDINSNVPVILVSGLDWTPEVAKLRALNKIGFLNKPFHEEELIKAIKERTGS